MKKSKVYKALFFVIVLALLAGNFVYPSYFNRGVDFLNGRFNSNLPHFWDRPFRLGLDLQGGTHLLYEANVSDIPRDEQDAAMEGLRDIIERRVNLFGVQEPLVQTQETAESKRLVVELAGVTDPAEAIRIIGETPFLEFKEQRSEAETQEILDVQKEIEGKSFEEVQTIEGWQRAFEDPYFKSTDLTGQYLKRAKLDFDQTTQQPLILLQFNGEGSDIFEQLTTNNVGQPIAIYVDNILLSAPIVNAPISGGRAQISGSFTIDEARELVRSLNAGALPVPIQLISQQSIGPTLGKVSLEKSLKAGIAGLLAVVVFMVIFYRLPGVLASLALGIYVALVLSIFKLIPVTLTLAGIGGFVLSIGMAVDANVLIFSRMREELKEGKSFSMALTEGFKRSWPSIRDGSLTTLLAALILFWFGTSFIKGFAFTLSIGIVVSMFSALFITRSFLSVFAGTRLEQWKWLWR